MLIPFIAQRDHRQVIPFLNGIHRKATFSSQIFDKRSELNDLLWPADIRQQQEDCHVAGQQDRMNRNDQNSAPLTENKPSQRRAHSNNCNGP
jgi:hypothetical protein